jgi:rubredoxin
VKNRFQNSPFKFNLQRYIAGEDGKMWVCQGCGYIYDGSVGKWGEDKRCPACGERRFALKSQAEMNIAAGGLAVSVGLIGLLFLLIKVA